MKALLPFSWGGYKPARREEYFEPFHALHREMDRLFDEATRGLGVPTEVNGVLAPRIDVSETEKEIEVTAELPGLEEKDIEVTLNDNMLAIRGEKKVEREEQKRDFYLRERSVGAFSRQIQLPFGVNSDKVEASFKNGVLTVKVPKPKEIQAKSKKVAIKSAV